MPKATTNHSLRGRGEVKSTDHTRVGSGTSGRASASVPMARETLARISEVLNNCLDQAPSLEKELLSSLGKDDTKISNEGHLIIDWIRGEKCKEVASSIGKEAVD